VNPEVVGSVPQDAAALVDRDGGGRRVRVAVLDFGIDETEWLRAIGTARVTPAREFFWRSSLITPLTVVRPPV